MTSTALSNRPRDPAIEDALKDLALDLRWSFNHSADHIWKRLDTELWELTRNPWVVLQTVSREKLQSVTSDPNFQQVLADLRREKAAAEGPEAWFQRAHPQAGLSGVAYFSLEFMLSEALPIYSGGLGNVAGDQLKTASNLGVPVSGVTLLYQQGYFRQEIDGQGNQQALYPFNDPGELPIQPLRDAHGEWLRVSIELPDGKLSIRTWMAHVGRTKLYLLDTNDPANTPAHRAIASELYGGNSELRLKQELVLGIGGWRLLQALGLRPEVCHLNEGHAAFAALERARSYMAEHGKPFAQALTVTRAGNLFTTHTPVEAGFDRFDPGLAGWYLQNYAEKGLGISLHDLLALGRRDGNDGSEPFNMAYLAIHASGAVNGVSRLHGQVSRKLFAPLFVRWPEDEVPVSYVTNGVHVPTWDSAAADQLWEAACGKDRWRESLEGVEEDMRKVSDRDLWQLRNEGRKALVQFVRKRYARQLAGHGAPPEELARAAEALDENMLTLGFARRFATYKRPNLLLHDQDRFLRILTNRQQPAQLVIAGKAHPADREGQEMIREWIAFANRPEARFRVIFLSDYDLHMAEKLVQGVDLWVNTPRRPWEASGTSGMKVLVNGGLNFSELDGWWAEAYAPEVGWAIGDGRDRGFDPGWDAAEAEAVYEKLEREIVPEFYRREQEGIPRDWVARVRESMARLTPRFSANRVVRQYTEEHYLSAAAAFAARAANNGALGESLWKWRAELDQHWAEVRFGAASVEQKDGRYEFQVQLFLGGLGPDAVKVELYAEGQNPGADSILAMQRGERIGAQNGFAYRLQVPAARPARDYTPRVVAFHAGAAVPLEAGHIWWYDAPPWH